MPYQTKKDLPEAVQHLPKHGQEIYLKAVNAAFEQYKGDEEKAHATAWAAVKQKYRKEGEKWVAREAATEEEGNKNPSFGRIIEAFGEDGREWEVALIRAGLAKSGTIYPAEVLKEAVPLFEGVRALARSDEEHLTDKGVSTRNIVGWYDQARFEEEEIRARFHISEAAGWLATMMRDAWRRGKKDLIGFSIVGDGRATVRREGGQVVRYAEAITKIESVDPVVNPSAGGRVIRLIQGEGQQEGELEMIDKLLKIIEAERPDLLEGKDKANLKEEEIMALFQEAMKQPEKQEKEGNKETFKEGQGQEKDKDREDLSAKVERRLAEAECKTMLADKLAESKLPEITRAKIKKWFGGTIFKEADLDKVIAEERDYLAKFAESGQVAGLGAARAGMNEKDKVIKALDGFFEAEDIDKVPRFRSFRKAYEEITGDVSLTGRLAEAKNLGRFTEGLTTSSWAQILGDSITRKMLKEYNVAPLQDWRKIVSDITAISDFRTNRRLRLGGFGVLPSVAAQGTYTELTSPGDEEATYAIGKYGGLETVTMEMIANDDVGSIRRIPVRLGRAAARTLYKAIFDIFTANSGQGVALTITGDTDYLFKSDDTHGNYATTALSHAGLNEARYKMRTQTAFGDSYEYLGLTPKYLLIPNELEELAFKLCMGAYTLISAATTEISDAPNLHNRERMDYIVVDYWTDANNWYVVCDPKECPTIEVGFFQGREEPELFVQDQPTVGSMFSADKITYKIRHIWGYCVLDYRGFQGRVVS